VAPDSKICITLPVKTASELSAALEKARQSGNSLVEIRFDALDAAELPFALKIAESAAKTGTKILATFRPRNAGGHRDISDEEKKEFWNIAANSGFWAGDFEPDDFLLLDSATIGKIKNQIVSYHSFAPDDVSANPQAVYENLASIPQAVIKIAITVNDAADAAGLWQLFSRAEKFGRQLIPIAMGEAGKWTRILGPAFGAPFSFASQDEASAAAPGQISATDLKKLYRADSLSRQTKIFGLLAGDTSYSFSPLIHNSAFASAGMDCVFIPFQSQQAGRFLETFINSKLLNIKGLAVTNPHKVEIIGYLDELDDTARSIGAVNTVKIEGDRLLGFNTDVKGFIVPLKRRYPDLSGARAAIIGTGGAARAVTAALLSEKVNVVVFGRDPNKAAKFARDFSVASGRLPAEGGADFRGFDILVNATPAGTAGEFADVRLALPDGLRDIKIVYDLVYNPERTPLIIDAEQAGAATIGGLEMLIAQAEAQFEIWTGVKAPKEVMAAAVRSRLNKTSQTSGKP
jgi:3-dehydroquinate dehydratase/shikimate dehydrogenase